MEPLPPPERGARRQDPGPNGPTNPAALRPNYALRRAAAGAAALAVVGGAAFFVASRGDSADRDSSGAPEWTAIAAVDARSGDVVLFARDGGRDEPIDGPLTGVDTVVSGGRHVVMSAGGQVAVVDVGSGEIETIDGPEDAVLRQVAGTSELVLAAIAPQGGNAVIITPDTAIDVGAAADVDDPLFLAEMLRADRAGTSVMLSDARTFQTLVVPTDGGDVRFVAGASAGFSGDDAVTVQRAGSEAELIVTPLDGDGDDSGDSRDARRITVEDPAALLLGDDGSLVVVTGGGAVGAVAPEADTGRPVRRIDLGGDGDAEAEVERADAFPAIGRLVVSAGSTLTVLDGDGAVVATVAGTVAGGPAVSGHPAQRCLPIAGDGGAATLDLVTGDVVGAAGEAETGGAGGGADRVEVGGVSADGCTVAWRDGPQFRTVTRAGDPVSLAGGPEITAVSPDGTHVVARAGDGTSALWALDEPDAPVAELGDLGPSYVVFVER